MGLPIASHNACPVHCEYHMQILEAHILNHLIHCPLQKSGINRHHGNQSPQGKACRKGHGVFLGNAHIKKTFREHIAEPFQPCSVRHGRCDCYHAFLPVAEFPHDCGKNIRVVGLPAVGKGNSVFQVKCRCAVESGGMPHGRLVSPAFFREHMDQHRTLHFPGLIEYLDHTPAVVAADGSQIFDTHILKEHTGNDQLFDTVLCLVYPLHHGRADPRHLVQRALHLCLEPCVGFRCAQIAQVLGDAAHILGNGHFIVI